MLRTSLIGNFTLSIFVGLGCHLWANDGLSIYGGFKLKSNKIVQVRQVCELSGYIETPISRTIFNNYFDNGVQLRFDYIGSNVDCKELNLRIENREMPDFFNFSFDLNAIYDQKIWYTQSVENAFTSAIFVAKTKNNAYFLFYLTSPGLSLEKISTVIEGIDVDLIGVNLPDIDFNKTFLRERHRSIKSLEDCKEFFLKEAKRHSKEFNNDPVYFVARYSEWLHIWVNGSPKLTHEFIEFVNKRKKSDKPSVYISIDELAYYIALEVKAELDLCDSTVKIAPKAELRK